MTDEQFRQLMDKLDEIMRRLPVTPPQYAGYFPNPVAPSLSFGQCGICGGYHGGLQCPCLSHLAGAQ